MKNEMISNNTNNIGNIFERNNDIIKHSGDKITQEKMPGGDIITRIDTKEKKATHRQYTTKDGKPGRQTITIMQPDK